MPLGDTREWVPLVNYVNSMKLPRPDPPPNPDAARFFQMTPAKIPKQDLVSKLMPNEPDYLDKRHDHAGAIIKKLTAIDTANYRLAKERNNLTDARARGVMVDDHEIYTRIAKIYENVCRKQPLHTELVAIQFQVRKLWYTCTSLNMLTYPQYLDHIRADPRYDKRAIGDAQEQVMSRARARARAATFG
jgi:hypothetical protein